jgi:hypothetical protein
MQAKEEIWKKQAVLLDTESGGRSVLQNVENSYKNT